MRCQHETHNVAEPRGGDGVDGRLDLRFGVLQAEAHLETARLRGVECVLQRVALCFGAGGEGRGSTQCVVTGSEVGQRLGCGRPTATDVGVVGLDLFPSAGSAVRHEQHGHA